MYWLTMGLFLSNLIFLIDPKSLDNLAIENFREYLRIPTVQPNVNYTDCVEFLKKQAKDIGLPIVVYEINPSVPFVILRWDGQNTALPSIMFNSHMDVVPVEEEYWTYPPFKAQMIESGKIYARGAQDSKSTGMQYLEAIRRLRLNGYIPKRTLYVTFTPNEEVGGIFGMRQFVKTDYLKNMNVGFALDEGRAHPEPGVYYASYTERTRWEIWVTSTGSSGHASLLLQDNAADKMRYMLNKFLDMRGTENKKLDDPNVKLEDVTSINLTILKGGIQSNVIPSELTAVFDMRIDMGKDLDKLEETIRNWCREAGEGTVIKFERKEPRRNATKLDASNIYWTAMKDSLKDLGIRFQPNILISASDARFLREIGIPTIGLRALANTPYMGHANDEFVFAHSFLEGIQAYERIMTSLGDIEAAEKLDESK